MNNKDLLEKYVPIEKQEEAKEMEKRGVPIQYIIGNVDFCGNLIFVDERVLIPRFETEELVDRTIKLAKERFKRRVHIVDLGTGSGCIAISLKKALDSLVTAVDISEEALGLAKENALYHQVDIEFVHADISNCLSQKYDIIVSNPPYIPFDGFVQENVKQYEPHLALFAKDYGLYFYKKILSYAFSCLHKDGFIAFEIGDGQKELLEEYLRMNFKKKKYCFQKDLAGLYRYLFIFNE